MFCRKCGSEIPDDSVFCSKCGTPTAVVSKADNKEEKTEIIVEQITTGSQHESAIIDSTNVPSKRKKGPVVLVSIIVIALVLGGLYYYIQSKDILKNKGRLDAITASCLKIECYDLSGALETTGSGFIAFSDDIVVTNYHVIEGHPFTITAVSENGYKYPVDSIMVSNPDVDIAILHLQRHTGLTPLTLSGKPAEKTDKVVAIGSPLGMINVVSDGIVSGFTQIDNLSGIQFTASISHGSSGGVLLNRYGEVVGVTFASFTEGQNLNIAIPIDYVETLFNQRKTNDEISIDNFKAYPVSYILANSSSLFGKVITVQGFVSTVSNKNSHNQYIVLLVATESDVLGFDGRNVTEEEFNNSDEWTQEYHRFRDFGSIVVLSPASLGNQKLTPGSFITITGRLYKGTIASKNENYIGLDNVSRIE